MKEDWMQKKWRPMMAVMYMVVCIFDFVLFPIMFTIVQFWEVEAVNDAFRQWVPITLGGGGLFHVAMGAVLGVTAWSRGQEKIAGASTSTNVILETQTQQEPKMIRRQAERDETLYSASIERPRVVSGYKGKAGPSQEEQPLI